LQKLRENWLQRPSPNLQRWFKSHTSKSRNKPNNTCSRRVQLDWKFQLSTLKDIDGYCSQNNVQVQQKVRQSLHRLRTRNVFKDGRMIMEPQEDPSFTQAFQFLKETEFYSVDETKEEEHSSLSSPSYSFTSKGKTDLVIAQAKAKHFIVVNQVTQKDNPLNGFIKQVLWNYGNIVPDYLLGRYTCALFLRISQHLLTPHHIYDRVKAIGKQFRLRLVICLIDVEDFELALKEVS